MGSFVKSAQRTKAPQKGIDGYTIKAHWDDGDVSKLFAATQDRLERIVAELDTDPSVIDYEITLQENGFVYTLRQVQENIIVTLPQHVLFTSFAEAAQVFRGMAESLEKGEHNGELGDNETGWSAKETQLQTIDNDDEEDSEDAGEEKDE